MRLVQGGMPNVTRMAVSGVIHRSEKATGQSPPKRGVMNTGKYIHADNRRRARG